MGQSFSLFFLIMPPVYFRLLVLVTHWACSVPSLQLRLLLWAFLTLHVLLIGLMYFSFSVILKRKMSVLQNCHRVTNILFLYCPSVLDTTVNLGHSGQQRHLLPFCRNRLSGLCIFFFFCPPTLLYGNFVNCHIFLQLSEWERALHHACACYGKLQ